MINSLTMPIRLMSCWGIHVMVCDACESNREEWINLHFTIYQPAYVRIGAKTALSTTPSIMPIRPTGSVTSTGTNSRSVARDDDHPEILVELNVVLASLHFASSTS